LPFQGLAAGRPVRLEPADGPPLAPLEGVRDVSIEYVSSGNPMVVGETRHNATLVGVEASFGALRHYVARSGGRFLSERDVAERRRVAFLGHRIAQDLFAEGEPVGETLWIRGVPFTVVGVAPPKIAISNYNGDDRDKVAIPATAFRDLRGWRFVSHVWVGLESPDLREPVLADVRRVLAARHRFDPADEDALEVHDYVAIRELVDGILDGTSIFTGVVAVLGFLVSVVGVVNVMVALVEERKRELGIQLALGAQPRRLALERLIEGLVVTLTGGLAGMLACALLLRGMAAIPMPVEVLAYMGRPALDPVVGFTIVALLVLAGALAGWAPARLAARLDPVEVLRDE